MALTGRWETNNSVTLTVLLCIETKFLSKDVTIRQWETLSHLGEGNFHPTSFFSLPVSPEINVNKALKMEYDGGDGGGSYDSDGGGGGSAYWVL